jgi:cell division protein FtsB
VVDVKALQRENAQLREQVSALTRELAKLNDRITELLAVAQRRHRKPAVEKPPQVAPEVTPETD